MNDSDRMGLTAIGYVASALTDPRDDPSRPVTGVFSTRSPDRPNPIGLHEVHVREVGPTHLIVSSLEAINRTPVLDIKPVLGAATAR